MRSHPSFAAVVALLAVTALAVAAPPAAAGEYSIYACAVPGREAADQGPWLAHATGDPAFQSMPTSTCGSEGWFGRSDATSMFDTYPFAGGFAGFRAEVPAGRPIEIRNVQVNGRVSYTKPADSAGSLLTAVTPIERGFCSGTGTCDSTWEMPFAPGTRSIQLGVTCTGGGACKTGKTYRQQWRWTVITAAENELPAITPDGGPLLAGGSQRGTRRLAVTASDADSGVSRIRVRLDGQTAADQRLFDDPVQCSHRDWHACATGWTGELDVDTTAVADGSRVVSLVVTDAAGNETTADAGRIVVDNVPVPVAAERPAVAGSPVVGDLVSGTPGRWTGAATPTPLLRWKRCTAGACEAIPGATTSTYRVTAEDVGRRLVLESTAANAIGETATADSDPTAAVAERPSPSLSAVPQATPAVERAAAPPAANGTHATASAKLVARLARGQTTRRIRYGSAATVTGKLTDERDRPIAGASVIVTERVRRVGSKPRVTATVTTDAQGAFSYRVKPGPSRELSFGYRAFSGDRDVASTTTVTVLVRAKVTLRTHARRLRNGQRLRFSGVIRGRPAGRTGPLVDLQVVVRGRWRSFLRGAVRADRNGRFRASYRFRRTFSTQTYRFRAVARQDSAYPYLAGTSNTVPVRVRP